MIGTLAVGGWAVIFGTASMGLGGAAAHPGPSRPKHTHIYTLTQLKLAVVTNFNISTTINAENKLYTHGNRKHHVCASNTPTMTQLKPACCK